MSGTLYAVGVGPGDPELLTLKALRVLRASDVVACPAKDGAPGAAYRIAREALAEIAEKELLPLAFPMTNGDCSRAHREAAERIMAQLRGGKNVAFLTLGDPAFYSTFHYIREAVAAGGFPVETVSGVPSFCAASARLSVPLVLGDGEVLITSEPRPDFSGTIVVMKAGSRLRALREQLARSGREAYLVENCGMADERVYSGVRAMPDKAGYFSLLIIKGSAAE